MLMDEPIYGLLTFTKSYSNEAFLLPIESAAKVVKHLARAKVVHTDYGDKIETISDYEDEIRLKIISSEKVKQLCLEKVINP